MPETSSEGPSIDNWIEEVSHTDDLCRGLRISRWKPGKKHEKSIEQKQHYVGKQYEPHTKISSCNLLCPRYMFNIVCDRDEE